MLLLKKTYMKPHPIFVHIPKCAGTYIVSAVQARGIKIKSHIEGLVAQGKLDQVSSFVDNGFIISGHLTCQRLDMLASQLEFKPIYHASFRNPTSQLLSQLNWQVEVALRGPEFLGTHPSEVISIIKEVLFCDLSNSDSILQVVDSHPGYFMNNQSTFLIGGLNSRLNSSLSAVAIKSKLLSALDGIDVKGVESTYNTVVDSLCDLGVASAEADSQASTPDANASRKHILFSGIEEAEAFLVGVRNRQVYDMYVYESLLAEGENSLGDSDMIGKLITVDIKLRESRDSLLAIARENLAILEERRQLLY